MTKIDILSPRERRVLAFIGAGLPDKLIAYEMGVSEYTVKTHGLHIREKLGQMSRPALALYAHGIDAGAALEKARNFEVAP